MLPTINFEFVLIFLFVGSLTAAQNQSSEFTSANNLFAQSVYKQLSQNQKGNFLVSPFSAEIILAFALSGSRGETAEQLGKALYLPKDKNNIEAAIKTLVLKLKGDGLYILNTANKLYVDTNFTLRNEFKDAGNQIYGAESETIDFFPNNVQAAKIINDWLEKHTNDKIKNLVYYDDFDEFTTAVLVNALYFKANWSNPFLLGETRKAKFYKTPDEVIEIDTLHHYEQYFNYYECQHLKAQFLELPFKGGEASMVIVLPMARDGLSSLEKQLDKVFLPQLKREFLDVALPKFEIETSVDFKKILRGLGARNIFQEKIADLSGMAGDPGDLFVKKVIQKTFIDVSEEGVEAAAATYVVVVIPESYQVERPKEFVANHPFIFYIKIKDVVIFIGRVIDPSDS